ncbi:FH protein interacting protein FIP2 [Balamuthia mandrillaris]
MEPASPTPGTQVGGKEELEESIENLVRLKKGLEEEIERLQKLKSGALRASTASNGPRSRKEAKEKQKEEEEEEEEAEELEVDGATLLKEQWVKLDVGGHRFVTRRETLCNAPGMLSSMFSGTYKLNKRNGYYFIDRDGTHFRYILNYLRNGILALPLDNKLVCTELLIEAKYYQLNDVIEIIEKEKLHYEELYRKQFLPMLSLEDVITPEQKATVELEDLNSKLLFELDKKHSSVILTNNNRTASIKEKGLTTWANVFVDLGYVLSLEDGEDEDGKGEEDRRKKATRSINSNHRSIYTKRKYYWELYIDELDHNNMRVGITTERNILNVCPNSNSILYDCCGYFTGENIPVGNGQKAFNFRTNSVLGFMINIVDKEISFFLNRKLFDTKKIGFSLDELWFVVSFYDKSKVTLRPHTSDPPSVHQHQTQK